MASGGSPKKRLRLENPDNADDAGDMDLYDDKNTESDEHCAEEALDIDAEEQDEDQSFLSRQSAYGPWNEWSVEDVAQKLIEWGIPDDAVQKFRAHKIDGRILDKITEDHVKDVLEICELGTQLKIQEFLKTLASEDSNTETKVFNDPVHGHMNIHKLCVTIIDTPEFQRLRYLKQLGMCYFVYPGASHNRFEHSLGVCYLAGKLVKALRSRQPNLGITDTDVLCVKIAGLCHDMGHGPFSHLFDNQFIPYTRPEREWEHEEASVRMFKYMVEENQLEPVFERYGIGEAERTFIMEQIIGKPLTKTATDKMTWYYEPTSEKAFLYEIVANKRNGVDVDKWDYFKRDCLYLGMGTSFDYTRFIKFSRVIRVGEELQICVRDKEVYNMYEMFYTRQALHRKAYQHKAVQAVEIMMVEALKEADEYIMLPGKNGPCKMSQSIEDISAYVHLTDSIFHQILLSEDPNLMKAQGILQDIQKRKLYKCVGESEPITAADVIQKSGDAIKDEILKKLSEQKEKVEQLELDTSRFVVQIVKLDFGKKDENPLNDLLFFSKVDRNQAKAVKASEVSVFVPQDQFKEQLVRLFLRPTQDSDADEKCLQLLRHGFELWCEKKLRKPKMCWIPLTPCKSESPSVDNNVTPNHPIRRVKPGSMTKAKQTLTY